MKKFLLLIALAAVLPGCATIVNDHRQPVHFTAAEPGTPYTVTNRAGRQVVQDVTPSTHTLPAAAGYFRGERYAVQSGETTAVLDSRVTGWYWAGVAVSLIGALVIDPLTGDMYELPDSFEVTK